MAIDSRDLVKRLEDCQRWGVDDDRNEVAELGTLSDGLEYRRWRNGRTTCHEDTWAVRLFPLIVTRPCAWRGR